MPPSWIYFNTQIFLNTTAIICVLLRPVLFTGVEVLFFFSCIVEERRSPKCHLNDDEALNYLLLLDKWFQFWSL